MKVGDYVRTKSYGIKKIIGFSSSLTEDFVNCDHDKYQNVLINKKEIFSSSNNIIDLIEVGDYVNGHKVLDVYKDINGQMRMKFGENNLILAYKSNYDNYYLFGDEIKSIVTKEQFEAIQYEVDK